MIKVICNNSKYLYTHNNKIEIDTFSNKQTKIVNILS